MCGHLQISPVCNFVARTEFEKKISNVKWSIVRYSYLQPYNCLIKIFIDLSMVDTVIDMFHEDDI